jgi:hypothetical protein
MPAMAASTQQLDVDDADGILEPDFEQASPEPALESNPATSSGTPSTATATATSKFPWQPSPKMAEPMASALRRAAEAAGQMEATETIPAKSPVAPPALEKRPSAMSGAMFQAQGHAAAPARAVEKLSPVAVAPAASQRPKSPSSTPLARMFLRLRSSPARMTAMKSTAAVRPRRSSLSRRWFCWPAQRDT